MDLKFLAFVSNFTIFSNSRDGKKRGVWARVDVDISSQSLLTVVILSFTVGNIIETSGDLPMFAAQALKFTKSGLISPRGL